MGPFAVAGAVTGLAKGIFGAIQGAKMLKEAKSINPFYEPYKGSEAAKAMAGQTQARLNAVNPAFMMQQRGIAGSQANAMANVSRNATDASQRLAMAAGIQSGTDQALSNLGAQVDLAADKNMQNWMSAQNVLLGEDRMKYQDMMNKYQMDLQQKNALRSAGQQNIASGLGAIGSTAFGLAQLNMGNATTPSNTNPANMPYISGVGQSMSNQASSFIQSRKKK